MAPIIHDSEIEQRLLLTDRFDNRPLNPSDGDSATELLESHRPLPTTYLLALSQDLPKGAGLEYHTPPLGDTQGEALYYPDNVGHCESTIMGFADSVMTPLTAQDGPMLVVLISMILSVVFVVEMYEYWQRRTRRIYLRDSIQEDVD
ncbi:hypothetical protein E8E14_002174 [Neopestalotiopsis sp. 37M]|nr:hypothetical protein E8E14_002174 [Neopestalotiopsis sp. 37M]